MEEKGMTSQTRTPHDHLRPQVLGSALLLGPLTRFLTCPSHWGPPAMFSFPEGPRSASCQDHNLWQCPLTSEKSPSQGQTAMGWPFPMAGTGQTQDTGKHNREHAIKPKKLNHR
jgi:hypothetical protein